MLAAMTAMVVVYAGAAWAASVSEVEPNDSIAQAQNIEGWFDLSENADIFDSTTIPHATVNGSGNDTVDYYAFTVPAGGMQARIGLLDIDDGMDDFDPMLGLYDSNGNLIAVNDDAGGDPGSTHPFDSFIGAQLSSGNYVVGVSRYPGLFFGDPTPIPTGADYQLHVSVEGHGPGFLGPVDNMPTLNSAKAGSAIPVKFSLGSDQGLNIMADGYPTSTQIACDDTGPTDAIEQTVTAGRSTLSYDASTDQYTYVWKTEKAWAGTCRQLEMKLADGRISHANFRFAK